MAREQFNHEWDPKKKKKDEPARDKKYPMNPYNKDHDASMGGKKEPKHTNPEKPKPKPRNNYNEQHDASMGGKKTHNKNPENPKGTEKPKPKGYPTDDLFKKMGEQKASVKIENIKKKTTESVLKEKEAAKAKLKKKSPTSRARALLPKTRKKKKK